MVLLVLGQGPAWRPRMPAAGAVAKVLCGAIAARWLVGQSPQHQVDLSRPRLGRCCGDGARGDISRRAGRRGQWRPNGSTWQSVCGEASWLRSPVTTSEVQAMRTEVERRCGEEKEGTPVPHTEEWGSSGGDVSDTAEEAGWPRRGWHWRLGEVGLWSSTAMGARAHAHEGQRRTGRRWRGATGTSMVCAGSVEASKGRESRAGVVELRPAEAARVRPCWSAGRAWIA